MEIKVNLHLTVSTEVIDLLSELIGNTTKKVVTPEPEKTVVVEKVKKEKPVKSEPVEASKNGVEKVDLSAIRQWIAGSESNKNAARSLLTTMGFAKLTDLPAEKYAEFFENLKSDL